MDGRRLRGAGDLIDLAKQSCDVVRDVDLVWAAGARGDKSQRLTVHRDRIGINGRGSAPPPPARRAGGSPRAPRRPAWSAAERTSGPPVVAVPLSTVEPVI